ncbi:MAG: hypothetical protein WD767_11395 [Alphaproteobacteria bacterium]
MKPDTACGQEAASLSDMGLRRPSLSSRGKDGDITAMLAAMPAAPEVLSDFDGIEPVTGLEMRDVTPRPSGPADVVKWWNGLRQSCPMPSRSQLTASELASRWPNLVLFRCGNLPGRFQPDSTFATALRANRDGRDTGLSGSPEFTAMLSRWMIRLANKALAAGAPVQEDSHFDTADGRIGFTLVALPFGEDSQPDHILCHVQQDTSAERPGRR